MFYQDQRYKESKRRGNDPHKHKPGWEIGQMFKEGLSENIKAMYQERYNNEMEKWRVEVEQFKADNPEVVAKVKNCRKRHKQDSKLLDENIDPNPDDGLAGQQDDKSDKIALINVMKSFLSDEDNRRFSTTLRHIDWESVSAALDGHHSPNACEGLWFDIQSKLATFKTLSGLSSTFCKESNP